MHQGQFCKPKHIPLEKSDLAIGGKITICNCANNGLDFNTASCALRTLAAATSLMASVIRLVFLTVLMRSRSIRVLPIQILVL